MPKALIVGNGISRQKYDIENFKYEGYTIWGMNALYRDYPWIDYLVALDSKIIKEINSSEFPKNKFLVPTIEEQYEPIEYNPNRPRMNAAMSAMREAIKRGYKEIVSIGLDFMIEDKKLNIANIYDGTNGYEEQTRASYFDTISRAKFMDWYASQNPKIIFKFLFPQVYKFRNFKSQNIKIEITCPSMI